MPLPNGRSGLRPSAPPPRITLEGSRTRRLWSELSLLLGESDALDGRRSSCTMKPRSGGPTGQEDRGGMRGRRRGTDRGGQLDASPIERFGSLPALPEAATVLQARRNALARRAFLDEVGAMTPSEAVARAGISTSSPSRHVSKWIASQRAFAVVHGGRRLLPSFQFDSDSGQLRPEVAQLLAAFENRRKGWEVALWMTSPNGWLRGRRPIDLWPAELEFILEAARLAVADIGT